MAYITRRRTLTAQPQYSAQLKKPGFWRLVDIQSRPPVGQNVTRTLNATAALKYGMGGAAVDFPVLGDYVSYGSDTNLQLSTMTGISVVEMPSTMTTRAVLFNTNCAGASSGGFVIYVHTSGTIEATKLDIAVLGTNAKAVRRGTGLSTVVWSYNGVTGSMRIAVDGVLTSGTSIQTFNHGLVTRNRYYLGNTTYSTPHKEYLFALSDSAAISNAELIALSVNPWQIFQAPSRTIFYVESAPSGDGVGSASGESTVLGVGASDNAQPGAASGSSTVSGIGASVAESVASSSGTSTVSGVGSAVIESVGSASGTSTADGVGTSGTGSSGSASGTSSVSGAGASVAASEGVSEGVALASGVGASVAASTGISSGTSTVSGVGDSTQAGSSVGSASGASTASGVGASVVAAVGSASGSSTVTGKGSSTGGEVEVEDFGGDDAPIIIRKRKKKTLREQPNKHLEHILNKAVEEFQGKVRPILKLKKNKELEVKEPVLVPAPSVDSKTPEFEGIKTLEDSEKDAEKVAQLLAVYQQQVAAQDDEDLIMLLAELF